MGLFHAVCPKLLNGAKRAGASAHNKMATPELKQFGELEAEDFERHPVWIGCHTADYGKPWYEDTDEETFRPYTGNLPADPAEGMLLVRAVIELHDGSRYPGFVTPAAEGWDKRPDGSPMFKHDHILGTQQPHIFVRDRQFGLWGGRVGIASQIQQELYAALGEAPDAIFPLRFNADAGLTTAICKGQIEGFYRWDHDGIQIEIAELEQDAKFAEDSCSRTWFSVGVRGHCGYPQPEKNFQSENGLCRDLHALR